MAGGGWVLDVFWDWRQSNLIMDKMQNGEKEGIKDEKMEL